MAGNSRFDLLTQYSTTTMTMIRNIRPPNEAPTIKPMLGPDSEEKHAI